MMKKTVLSTALAAVCAGGLTTAMAGMVTANLEDGTNGGGFFARVTISDLLNTNNELSGLHFVLDISQPINTTITQGDILGVWFDLNGNEGLLSPLSTAYNNNTLFQNVDPVGTISAAVFNANTVNKVGDSNNKLNGLTKTPFDIGIEVGLGGSAGGFNQTVSFDMMYAGLSASMFNDQRVAMRVQSITGVTEYTAGSSKLLGEGELPSQPPPGDVPPPPAPPSGGGDEPPPPPNQVPLPSTLLLLGAGLLGMGASFRRQK